MRLFCSGNIFHNFLNISIFRESFHHLVSHRMMPQLEDTSASKYFYNLSNIHNWYSDFCNSFEISYFRNISNIPYFSFSLFIIESSSDEKSSRNKIVSLHRNISELAFIKLRRTKSKSRVDFHRDRTSNFHRIGATTAEAVKRSSPWQRN